MTFEQNTESQTRPRSLLAPPGGAIDGPKAIFWNERELRAGWRLLIYLLLFTLFASGGIFLAIALHFPQVTRGGITAAACWFKKSWDDRGDGGGAILGRLERREFGVYGLPGAEAFGARFWQGMVGNRDDHGDDPADSSARRIFLRRAGAAWERGVALCGALGIGISLRGLLGGVSFSRVRAIHARFRNCFGPRPRCCPPRSAPLTSETEGKTNWAR